MIFDDWADEEHTIASDGSVVLTRLEAGDYELVLTIDLGHQWMHLLPPLARVHVDEDRETNVTLDTSRFAPARLDARLERGGPPLASARVMLHGDGGTYAMEGWELLSGWSFYPNVDDREHLVTDGIPPGTYRLVLTWDRGFQMTEPFLLEPGQTLTRTFAFARKQLRLRILDATGKPLAADSRCAVWSELELSSASANCELRTNGDGWITLDPAPGVPVRVYAAEGVTETAVVPAGQNEAAFELRVAPIER